MNRPERPTLSPAGRRPTLVEQAERIIRDEIIDGRLQPGARIHLHETAERLNMSMVPLREALGVLTSEGLVVALRQRGFRVADIDLNEMEDIYALRLLLDPLAVRQSVPRMADADRTELAAAFAALDGMDTGTPAGEANRRFHFAIYRPCGSAWLLRILTLLWDASERYRMLSASDTVDSKHSNDEHERIYREVMKGDAEAAAAEMRVRTCSRPSRRCARAPASFPERA